MKIIRKPRFIFIAAIGLVLLVAALVLAGGKANAQGGVTPPIPGAQVVTTDFVNPYYTIVNMVLPDGTKLAQNLIKGPPTPPDGYVAERVSALNVMPATATILSEVPAFTWVFGCSAVSGSMVAGYYDRSGYPNIYTGPTNGGVVPLVEDGAWGTWNDTIGDPYPNNPLIASHIGLDGRAINGSIDDYWISYLSKASDPFIGKWTQHAWGDAVGDYMKTSQSGYGNVDGSTSFYGYNSASKLQCSQMGSVAKYDGTYGRKLFYEARGYTVTDCYSQATDNRYSGGFSLASYKAEINAGRPVFLNLAGHSIVGVGYDNASSTIYIHDTWDNSNHTMTWGGSYSNMALQSVSIVNLAAANIPPAAFNKSTPVNGAADQPVSLSLTWNATSPVTAYEYCYDIASGCTNWTSLGNATSVSLSGLAYSTTYYWQVRAWNGSYGPTAANGGAYWSFSTQAPPPPPPSAPTALSATDGTYTDKVVVSWTASSDATSYRVYRNTTDSSTGAVLLGSPSASPYNDTSAVAGTTYWYFVKACNAGGCSDYSTSDSGYRAVGSAPAAFSKIAPVNGATGQAYTLTLSWGASSGATSYAYCYSTIRNRCTSWTNAGGATSATLSGLKRRTTYYWQVRATNAFGVAYANGSSTAFWSFKTQ